MAEKMTIVQRIRRTTVLDNYFVSSRNASDRSPIILPQPAPKHTKTASVCSTAGGAAESSASGESRTPGCSNPAVKLICPAGLSDLPEIFAGDKDDLVEVINLDDAKADAKAEAKKAKQKSYEVTRKCQDTWAILHLWAEMIRGSVDTSVHRVRCRICTQVRGADVMMGPKTDTLEKHAGKRIAEKDLPLLGVKKGEVYVAKGCRHLKNAEHYKSHMLGRPTIAQQVNVEARGEKARKMQQFATIFHLLQTGRPMVKYESIQELFTYLKIPHMSRKHWSDSAGWTMAEFVHKEIVMRTKENLAASNYFAITCDEVTTIDNVSWISVHAYVVRDFGRIPMLLSLEKITEGATASRLSMCIIDAIEGKGGISRGDMRAKWVSFGADGAAVFQGSRGGVTKIVQERVAPHMEGIHCFSHRTNLAVKVLSHLPMIAKIETLLQSLHSCFSASPKRHLEFSKLAEVMHTKGLKILSQVKTRWLSMLSPLRRVMGEYKTLLAKMADDRVDKESKASARESAPKNFELLCDISVPCALTCFLPLLETVHDLIKFLQQRDIFVCDYVAAVKVCQARLYELYCNSTTCFSSDAFREFIDFLVGQHHSMTWIWTSSSLDLNCSQVEHVQFTCGHLKFNAVTGNEEGVAELVTREAFADITACVKRLCTEAAEKLITELSSRFPASNIMDSFGVMYPQYWLQSNAEVLFERHFMVIKEHFCRESRLGDVVYPALLSEEKLNHQCSTWKSTMKGNSADCMVRPFTVNPLMRLWRCIVCSVWLRSALSEWIKVAEIAAVQVLGSVEDERIFSSVAFTKGKLRNRLDEHLECAVGVYSQKYFTLNDFPFEKVYDAWRNDKKRKVES